MLEPVPRYPWCARGRSRGGGEGGGAFVGLASTLIKVDTRESTWFQRLDCGGFFVQISLHT